MTYKHMTTKLLHSSKKAALLLRHGGIVAFPTETVWGLGAALQNEAAIAKIFQAKGRPVKNPLIVHILNQAEVAHLAHSIPPDFEKLACAFWPGPLTLILKKKESVSLLATGGLDTVAIRVPSHPVARKLLYALKTPIVAPSANLSGAPSGTSFQDVFDDFSGKIEGILTGNPPPIFGVESTVLDLSEPPHIFLLREGAISAEKIIQKTQLCIIRTKENAPRSPGTMYKHYSPKTALCLLHANEKTLIEKIFNAEGFTLLGESRLLPSARRKSGCHIAPLKIETFYQELRAADRRQSQKIYIIYDDKTASHRTLWDRLTRASQLS